MSSGFTSSDDTEDYRSRRRRDRQSTRDRYGEFSTNTSSSRYSHPFPVPKGDDTADSIYMAEMVRYRELWQQSTEKLKETERRHWEEMQMKEKAFTNMVDVLQRKFDDCKSGLTRLGNERDDYQQKCQELTGKLQVTTQSLQKESESNQRNSKRTRDLENQLAQLGVLHEETKVRCEEIQERLGDAAAELSAKNEQITKHKITIETQSRDIIQLSDIVGKHVEKEKKRKKKELKEAEIIGKQSEELERLTEIVEAQNEKINHQKQEIASLHERVIELDGEEGRHQVVMEAQKKDIAYLTGYQSKQDEIIRMQREQIQKMHKRLNELKSKDVLAAEMKEQLLLRDEDLRQTLNSKKMIEKKLDMLHDKLKSKEYLTYVPLCQNCKQLRTRMQKMKNVYIKNTRSMKKRIEKLEKKLAEKPRVPVVHTHTICKTAEHLHPAHSPHIAPSEVSVSTVDDYSVSQRLKPSKSSRVNGPAPHASISSVGSKIESEHTQDSDGTGDFDDEWDIDFGLN